MLTNFLFVRPLDAHPEIYGIQPLEQLRMGIATLCLDEIRKGLEKAIDYAPMVEETLREGNEELVLQGYPLGNQ